MKRLQLLINYLTVLILIFCTFAIPAEAAFTESEWPKYCPVLQGDASKGYTLTELSAKLYDSVAPDFHDVRVAEIANGKMAEIPYDIVNRSNVLRETRLTASMINQGVNGKNSTATAYLGKTVQTHNRMVINTANRDFIKDVTVEGSDDSSTWFKIRATAKIADFNNYGQAFHQTGVTYDPVNYRYLRVTLASGTGDAVSIDSIDVLYTGGKSGTEKSTEMKMVSQQVSDKDKTSTVYLTSGYKNFPLSKLEIATDSTNFSRATAVFGSPDMKEWVQVGEGSLAVFNLADYRESQLTLPVNITGYRYLKVVIHNGDSTPLNISSVRGYYFPRYLLFPCKPGNQYRVYFGNFSVKAPAYDLSTFSSKIVDSNPPVWKMSDPLNNPLFRAKVVPESERHRWLLPGILAVMVAGLAVFIARTLPKVLGKGK